MAFTHDAQGRTICTRCLGLEAYHDLPHKTDCDADGTVIEICNLCGSRLAYAGHGWERDYYGVTHYDLWHCPTCDNAAWYSYWLPDTRLRHESEDL